MKSMQPLIAIDALFFWQAAHCYSSWVRPGSGERRWVMRRIAWNRWLAVNTLKIIEIISCVTGYGEL